MTTSKTDFWGNPLNIGDTVAYARGMSQVLYVGKVIGETNCKLRIEETEFGLNYKKEPYTRLVHPGYVVKKIEAA